MVDLSTGIPMDLGVPSCAFLGTDPVGDQVERGSFAPRNQVRAWSSRGLSGYPAKQVAAWDGVRTLACMAVLMGKDDDTPF